MCRIGKYIPDVSDKERRHLICGERQIASDKRRVSRQERQMSSHMQREEGNGADVTTNNQPRGEEGIGRRQTSGNSD